MSLNLAETKQIGTGLAERILKYVNSPSYLQDLMSGYIFKEARGTQL